MYPVTSRLHLVTGYILGNFICMMSGYQVHPSSVNVKFLTQVFMAHGRTFDVPARKSFSPWTWPVHEVLGFRFYPKRKIQPAPFFVLPAKIPCIDQQIIQLTVGKYGV